MRSVRVSMTFAFDQAHDPEIGKDHGPIKVIQPPLRVPEALRCSCIRIPQKNLSNQRGALAGHRTLVPMKRDKSGAMEYVGCRCRSRFCVANHAER